MSIMMEEKMTVDRFYQECAELLGGSTTQEPVKPVIRTDRYGNPKITNSNRWGPRTPGHGRFEGFGLIRVFGKTVHISLHNPISVNKHFKTIEEALVFLRKELPIKPIVEDEMAIEMDSDIYEIAGSYN
jgi:hypothetical protein